MTPKKRLLLDDEQEDKVNRLAERSRTSPSIRLDEIINDEYLRTFRVIKNDDTLSDDAFKDKRSVNHFNFMGNTIYRAYNLLTPHVANFKSI